MKSAQKAMIATALAVQTALSGCGTSLDSTHAIGGEVVTGHTQPKHYRQASEIPTNLKTYGYQIHIYPGTGQDFTLDPTLTVDEFNDISNFDLYCSKETDKLLGSAGVIVKQGITMGILEGGLGTLGYMLGFGSLIKPKQYLAAIGMSGVGGGLASGEISVEQFLAISHGYCMTGMVYKADELEGKLRRIFIAPTELLDAPVPVIVDNDGPDYPHASRSGAIPPPPHM